MLSVVAGLLFTLAPVQEADGAAELQAAVGKLVAAESLQFELLSESSSAGRDEGAGGPGGRRGGMSGGDGFTKTGGVWKKGLPLQLTFGDQVAYKQGAKLVHQGEQGQWQVVEMGRGGRMGDGSGRPAEGGPGAGQRPDREGAGGDARGGQGGGQGGEGRAGGAGGRSSFAPMVGGRALFGLMSVEAPAELFADFGAKVADVGRETKDGAVVYSGALSPAGAEGLAGQGGMPRSPRGGGDGQGEAPEVETSGTYSITVKDGAIVTAVFEVRRWGSFGERTFDRTTKRTLTFERVGAAELEVPAEVLALIQ